MPRCSASAKFNSGPLVGSFDTGSIAKATGRLGTAIVGLFDAQVNGSRARPRRQDAQQRAGYVAAVVACIQ